MRVKRKAAALLALTMAITVQPAGMLSGQAGTGIYGFAAMEEGERSNVGKECESVSDGENKRPLAEKEEDDDFAEETEEYLPASPSIATPSTATDQEETEEFEVTYRISPQKGAVVSGPDSVVSGETLEFKVRVKDGYSLSGVELSGDSLEPVKEENGRWYYEAEDIFQEPEVEILLDEISYPEFDQSEEFGDITVTVHAEEGILPQGTSARIQKVENIEAETEESSSEEEAFYFDITLCDEEGNELSSQWQKKGSVQVTFTGEAIDEAKEHAKDSQIVHVDEDGEKEVVKTIPMDQENLEEDGLAFNARHFSLYGVRFAARELVEGEGFTWDEDTKTLTITESTGDYTSAATDKPYQAYKDTAAKIVIDGDENTEIGSYAFYKFKGMTELEIKTCGNIKDHAFNFCSKLESVTIGSCGDIGDRAFGSCSALESLEITGSCGNFGPYVFQNCSKLKNFEISSCGNFGEDMFAGATALESVTIKECGDIPQSLFASQSKLKNITLEKCGNIGKWAFRYCTSLESVILRECGNIESNVFSGCTGMKELTIEQCGDIAQQAFLGMTNLEKVTIKKCGAIGQYAFGTLFTSTGAESCSALKEVVIEECESIGECAFYNLKNVETLTITKCNSIGEEAFSGVGNPIKELILDSCSIDKWAFRNANIESLTIQNTTAIGEYAFNGAEIENLTLSNIKEIGEGAFGGCKNLTSLTIENVDKLEEDTFKIYDEMLSNNVTEITLKNVRYIGNYAFKGFKNLETVNVEPTCQYVGAHAFSGCDKLTTITIDGSTKLGYSDSFVRQEYIRERVNAILAGKFDMIDPDIPIDEIHPEGWYSVRTGTQNRTEEAGDTQLTKEAKWNNEEKTVADVLIKAYYTTNRQMDFIFVVDCSNSMSGFGSDEAMNANFYNMQSKVMDMSKELLDISTLDTRIAFATFGEWDHSKSPFFEKGQGQEAQEYIWNEIVDYESNTNYSVGFKDALELVQENKGRNTTVIFISDGQPFHPEEVPEEYYGVPEAAAVRAEGVPLISVLQQVSASKLESSKENMGKIADKIFASTDLEGFSKAINDAVKYAYTTYTLTDTVDPDFELDVDSIKASSGTVTVGKDQAGNTTITWELGGEPFQEHTLQFQEILKPDENGNYPTGDFDTNEGDTVLEEGDDPVNDVPTPVLPREADEGELRITKRVTGSRGDTKRDFSFKVTLKDQDGNNLTGTYEIQKTGQAAEKRSLTDGSFTFTLRHNQQLIIKGLPEGTSYLAEETNSYGHSASVEGGSGVIIGGGVETAAFENYRGSGGGNNGGGGGGGGSDPDPGPGRADQPDPSVSQVTEVTDPSTTPGNVPPVPWYKLPVMGDEQFGPGFINDSKNEVALPNNEPSIIPQLEQLYARNQDLAGWLTVPGTGFGYPVMNTPTDPYYYQHHTFDRQADDVGIPFMGPYSTKDSMNVLIHGHNMRDVSQFGYIWNYQYPSFREKNPVIDFKTLTDGNGSYEVMSVFFAPEYAEGTEGVFWWYRYIGDMNQNQFDYFVQNVKALSLYDTGVTAEYGDKLITLETCASLKDSTRLVVVARKKASPSENFASGTAQT